MNERREPPAAWERHLRPRKERYWGWGVLLGLMLAFGAYRGGEWLLSGRDALRQRPAAPRQLPTPPATPGAEPDRPRAAPEYGTVTKCISRSGSVGYSDGECPRGTQADSVRIRRNLNLADGMSPAALEASRADNSAIAAEQFRQAQHEQQQRQIRMAQTAGARTNECGPLAAHIEWVDDMARQPQPAPMQDWLRNEKKQARDRQFALRCPQER